MALEAHGVGGLIVHNGDRRDGGPHASAACGVLMTRAHQTGGPSMNKWPAIDTEDRFRGSGESPHHSRGIESFYMVASGRGRAAN